MNDNRRISFFSNIIASLSALVRLPTVALHTESAKILWLIQLRWVAIAGAFALVGPALYSGFLSRDSVASFLGVIGVLFIFNLLNQFICVGRINRSSPLLICLHLTFDLAMLSLLLSLTGGFANPFSVLILLKVSLGGLLIVGRLGWPFLLLCHAALAGLQIQLVISNTQALLPPTLVTFAVYHALLYSFWIVMRSLGSNLERHQKRATQDKLVFEKQGRLRALGALAAGFSHEFASPLNAAKIRLERFHRAQNSEDLDAVFAALNSCEAVLHRMNSSQIDPRNFELKRLNLGELLRDIIETWQEEKPNAVVEISTSGEEIAKVPPINFAQVVLNLLDNAQEASPSSPILVSLEGKDQWIRLSFEDGGAGFAESVISRMGEPFVTTKPHGSGLGLYVSQLFTQSLGGDLKIFNLPRGGAKVLLEWPNLRSSL